MKSAELSKSNDDRIFRGIRSYKKIQKTVMLVDVSSCEKFQKRFNGLYRVRRNEKWRNSFYQLFQEIKQKQLGFSDFSYILNKLHEKTGRVEASFSSKILATLNPDMPIWDSIVLQKLCFKPPRMQKLEDRMKAAAGLYQKIIDWYKSPVAQQCLDAFNKKFSDYDWVSDVKKIDFYLWGTRK